MKAKFLVFVLLAIILPIMFMVGCKEVVKTENEEVEVTVVDTYRRRAYMVRCGKTWVTRPASYRVTVKYGDNEYSVSGSDTYYKFENKVGETAIGVLQTTYYDDGSIVQNIIKLDWSEVE